MAKQPPKVDVRPAVEHISYFPYKYLFWGIAYMAVPMVDYWGYYEIPRLAYQILMFLAGLWMIYGMFDKGFYKRRKEILKRYL